MSHRTPSSSSNSCRPSRSVASRREFLRKSSLGTGATIAAASAFAVPATVSAQGANDRINTAIIGIRGQGRHHIKYQTATPDVRIVTLCDPDENLFADRVKEVPGDHKVKTEKDMRRVFEDKDVDCVVIATPNYWHALATVWACQAGKDVYCEKPAHYCVSEGPKMIAAAKKHGRVVQIGTHLRANTGRQEAMKQLRDGVLGKIYMAKAFYHGPRKPIGKQADGPVPEGVDYDLWCGPSAKQSFNPNRFHYNWHWFWETGNGETGNNGPHLNDILIQAIDKQEELPVEISSHGGRFVWDDQAETPNTQVSNYTYADGTVASLEVRNLESNKVAGEKASICVYGEKGYMVIALGGKYETFLGGKPGPKGSGGGRHPQLAANFYDVVRSRKTEDLLAPVAWGATGASLCHLGNIAYRLGRSIEFDNKTFSCGDDAEANALLTRKYRGPFVMPEEV